MAAHPGGVATLALTWGRWLGVWEAAAAAATGADAARLGSDVEQLRAMCHTLGGMVVPAFGDAAPRRGRAWRSRLNDYAQVVDQVTASLAPSGNPIGNDKGPGGLTHRRTSSPATATTRASSSLGDRRAAAPARRRGRGRRSGGGYIRRLVGSERCAIRIVASPYRAVARSDGRHLCYPWS